jgi:hypothetical protein
MLTELTRAEKLVASPAACGREYNPDGPEGAIFENSEATA